MEYKTLEYYICEIVGAPEWLGNISESILSVSGCFGEVHPDLTYCFFLNNLKAQQKKYRKKYQLDENKLEQLKAEIGQMFENNLAIDGRFRKWEDAKYFLTPIFRNLTVSL